MLLWRIQLLEIAQSFQFCDDSSVQLMKMYCVHYGRHAPLRWSHDTANHTSFLKFQPPLILNQTLSKSDFSPSFFLSFSEANSILAHVLVRVLVHINPLHFLARSALYHRKKIVASPKRHFFSVYFCIECM